MLAGIPEAPVGMTVLESQACGTPAIVSDVGGPQEIVQNGKTGFILDVKSTTSWVEALDELIPEIINGSEIYYRFRKNSRDVVISSYKWRELLEDLLLEDRAIKQKNPELTESPVAGN